MNHTAADVTVLARTLRDLSSQGSQEMFTGPVGDDETHARGHEGGLLLCNAAVSKQRVAQEGPFKRLFQLCLHTTGPEIQERFPASRAAILDVTS